MTKIYRVIVIENPETDFKELIDCILSERGCIWRTDVETLYKIKSFLGKSIADLVVQLYDILISNHASVTEIQFLYTDEDNE